MIHLENVIDSTFSGVVSICKNGAPIFRKAFGYADLYNKRPNLVDTRFATASAGKAFIAAAIMKLVEDGRLSLQSRIGDLLTFDLKQISGDITIRQLLTHTSGIPDYFDEEVMDDYAALWADYPNYKIRSSADLIPLFIDKPMMYSPGEKFQYNNTGYIVLGLVIEQVTGRSFDAHLADAVFAPCHMPNAGYFALDRLPENCANAYLTDRETGEYYTNIYSVDAKGSGAGGAFISVGDVENFWHHFKRGDVVAKAVADEMLSPQVPEGIYGYGFWILRDGYPYFQGGDPGVSFISSCRENGVTITIVSNFEDDVWDLHKRLLALDF